MKKKYNYFFERLEWLKCDINYQILQTINITVNIKMKWDDQF